MTITTTTETINDSDGSFNLIHVAAGKTEAIYPDYKQDDIGLFFNGREIASVRSIEELTQFAAQITAVAQRLAGAA